MADKSRAPVTGCPDARLQSKSGPEVVALGVEHAQPPCRRRRRQALFGPLGELGEEAQASVVSGVFLTRPGQLLGGESPDRLEQPVAVSAVVDGTRIVDQGRKPVEDFVAVLFPAGTNGFGGVQGQAALGEHGKPPQEGHARGPGSSGSSTHRRPQGLMAGYGRRAPGQQVEPVGETFGDALGQLMMRRRRPASSMASGIPSRRAQMAATAGALSSVMAK